ncbi:hypothetical protein [Aphanothece sacrum]|uniref:HepT-like domain-containing protein n=1 Tax=Aphanothece sacrum FPU1 TaxID=1920663 RepID=A0A401IFW0_APHSA|nr:hypothetical protein [Aphanothece sacrum]GBF80173.1 hypothetical protein AsFPU1_1574 [Aphanothece sacrum FPU1]GBF85326.1 hypothetical protein AsFPU3_2385 [Aphanothece sacrum FPU3]
MDKNTLIILKTDLNAQLKLIQSISQKLNERANGLNSDDIIRLESVAYQIHNLYNATEDLLKIVATYFENNITEMTKWHSALLQRMAQDIVGIRPGLLSQETFLLLNSLRGFRHFFRHAYGTPIEYEQLKINLDKARNLLPNLEKDIANFIETISNLD